MKNNKLIILILILFLATVYEVVQHFVQKATVVEPFQSGDCKTYNREVSKQLCQKIINCAKNKKFETRGEPVDDEPIYQIDIFSDGKVLNKELWELCKGIYNANREEEMDNDYMFIKRYNMQERVRMAPHKDHAKYTVSVLLSDTKKFTGCKFFLLDKDFEFKDNDKEKQHRYIKKLGDKLPFVKFEQGDVLRFNSQQFHGVTPLESGERYLLTIFYGRPENDSDSDSDSDEELELGEK